MTPNIEKGPWTESVLDGYNHDQSLLFDGDGPDAKLYLVYGGGSLGAHDYLRPLSEDANHVISYAGPATSLIPNTASGLGAEQMVPEGAHAYKIGNYYYIFHIDWVQGGNRREIVWRGSSLAPDDPSWQGRVAYYAPGYSMGVQQGDGLAQGGVFQAADGQWYSMLFTDGGPMGRFPELAQVNWSDDGWPTFSSALNMDKPKDAAGNTASSTYATDVATTDSFDNGSTKAAYWNSTDEAEAENWGAGDSYNGSNLNLDWQWNHNPDNRYWSLTERSGYLRLHPVGTTTGILAARNTLTQRALGPQSSGSVALDTSGMKPGDVAGLSIFQQKYGLVGVSVAGDGSKHIIMQTSAGDSGAVDQNVQLSNALPADTKTVYLKADCLFYTPDNQEKDQATFYYSVDGKAWTAIGQPLSMTYSLKHFIGNRFALFSYNVRQGGGYADFDYFYLSDDIGADMPVKPMADKTALKAAIDQATALHQADYSSSSWAALAKALTAAQTIYADNAASQAQVDAARSALEAAIKALKPADSSRAVDLYRLYNPNTGEHLYTSSAGERNQLKQIGWRYEGTMESAPAAGKPVYRVFNPHAKGGDHYYTLNKSEANGLVTKGWKLDNKGQPVFYSGGSVKVYVAYNPHAKSGAHNYTTSQGEQNSLLKAGWKYGAVAWMALAPGHKA